MTDQEKVPVPDTPQRRSERSRWWTIFVAPVLFLATGVALIAFIGVAQRVGWIQVETVAAKEASASADGEGGELYICPMMCTPPQKEPGRCPVCAMELVKSSQASSGPSTEITIEPAARRLANIATAPAKKAPVTRRVRVVGRLQYDEGSLKTIAAYVDGRLEKLSIDYTGAVVEKGDRLGVLYSPRLYSAQVEFLLAKRAVDRLDPAARSSTRQANVNLFENARQRLIELGMTPGQIAQLEQSGKADSRLALLAPMSGTVIRKLAVEGQYVKEGQSIYQLADLSSLWLMLELFPEDAAALRYGLRVDAEVQSFPGKRFSGRIVFVDPCVESKTRTVSVRVVLPNERGLLRVGDYARATIEVPLSPDGGPVERCYDPELAGKWIGPKHPHIVQDQPGRCRICGAALVAAADFGFTGEPAAQPEAVLIPRSAVLHVGDHAVAYVETQPGVFQLRRLTVGPITAQGVVVLDGIRAGEEVAVQGAFLIDSQMQLAGNPSLLDPEKAGEASSEDVPAPDIPQPGGMEMEIAEEAAPAVPIPSDMELVPANEASESSQRVGRLPEEGTR